MNPAPIFQKPGSALILLGHGSTVNPDSSAPTLYHAGEIKRRGCFGEVVCAFWKEEPGFRQVLDMVESTDIYIVPNFISEGYFTQKIIPRELGLHGPVTTLPARPGRPARILKYCEPAGNHSRMTEFLLDRAREAAPGVDPGQAALVIVGHGTSLNENSGLAVNKQAARIRARHQYAEVLGMFIEQTPFVTGWQQHTTAPNVIVVPFFISDGMHSYQDIPVLLGIQAARGAAAGGAEIFRRDPYSIGGRRLYYSSAIGADRLFTDVILDQGLRFDTRRPRLSRARDVASSLSPGCARR